MPFAEQTLGRHGDFLPFGAAVDTDGQIGMLAADPGLGERPPSQQVLDFLYAGARQQSEERRAVAFVADVRTGGGDAVRVELEHREGTALVILLPYSRSRFTKKVAVGQISVSLGERRIWAD